MLYVKITEYNFTWNFLFYLKTCEKDGFSQGNTFQNRKQFIGKAKRKGPICNKATFIQNFSKPKLHGLPSFPRLGSSLKQGVQLKWQQDREGIRGWGGLRRGWLRAGERHSTGGSSYYSSLIVTMWKCYPNFVRSSIKTTWTWSVGIKVKSPNLKQLLIDYHL